jgi:hypothetical protein
VQYFEFQRGGAVLKWINSLVDLATHAKEGGECISMLLHCTTTGIDNRKYVKGPGMCPAIYAVNVWFSSPMHIGNLSAYFRYQNCQIFYLSFAINLVNCGILLLAIKLYIGEEMCKKLIDMVVCRHNHNISVIQTVSGA